MKVATIAEKMNNAGYVFFKKIWGGGNVRKLLTPMKLRYQFIVYTYFLKY